MSWVVEFSSWDFDVFTSHAIMLCELKSLQQSFNMWRWITRKQEDGNWNIIESSVIFWVCHQCSDTKCARSHKVRHFFFHHYWWRILSLHSLLVWVHHAWWGRDSNNAMLELGNVLFILWWHILWGGLVLLGRAKLPADLMEGMFIALQHQALGQVNIPWPNY